MKNLKEPTRKLVGGLGMPQDTKSLYKNKSWAIFTNNEQSEINWEKSVIYKTVKDHQVFRDKFNEGCRRLLHWKL